MFNTVTINTLDMLLSCCEDLIYVLRIMTRIWTVIVTINYHMHLKQTNKQTLIMCAYWLFILSEAQFSKCRYNNIYSMESV